MCWRTARRYSFLSFFYYIHYIFFYGPGHQHVYLSVASSSSSLQSHTYSTGGKH
ncbi:hypothetical protein OG21DRAFT_848475 [Imleria badia]|nr:hypothetical protein OG21DRAFT_848475 [Imleria badia]